MRRRTSLGYRGVVKAADPWHTRTHSQSHLRTPPAPILEALYDPVLNIIYSVSSRAACFRRRDPVLHPMAIFFSLGPFFFLFKKIYLHNIYTSEVKTLWKSRDRRVSLKNVLNLPWHRRPPKVGPVFFVPTCSMTTARVVDNVLKIVLAGEFLSAQNRRVKVSSRRFRKDKKCPGDQSVESCEWETRIFSNLFFYDPSQRW